MVPWVFRRDPAPVEPGHRGVVLAQFDEPLVALLTDVFRNVLEVLADDADAGDAGDAGNTAPGADVAHSAPPEEDPLAAAVGIGTATTLPDNPVLARLLPDAYPDDPEAAGDFRRYTERGLRERKRAAVATVLTTLAGEGVRRLDDGEVRAWLSALNDARLALGTWLEVTEDSADAELDPAAPEFQAFLVYDLLSLLQESLLAVLGT